MSVNPLEARGATMSTYFIVDGRTISLQQLWNRGMITPGERLVEEDGLDYTIYTATFTDRPRVLLISSPTYQVMIGEIEHDSYQPREMSDEEYELVYSANEPEKQEEQHAYIHGVTDLLPDPVSIYDLPVL